MQAKNHKALSQKFKKTRCGQLTLRTAYPQTHYSYLLFYSYDVIA